jgi:hypothetical protein
MRILALDLARRMGYAVGSSGEAPTAGAKLLCSDGEPPEEAAHELGRFIRDQLVFKPELIVAERWIPPNHKAGAMRAVWQLQLHGALHGVLGCYQNIRFESPTVGQVRKHFCGQSSAGEKRGRERTWREERDDREATKKMVIDRAVSLGYLPKTRRDSDIADALALWDWASHTIARRPMQKLVMFGEAAE